MVGTTCYFAPERILGVKFSSSADIWGRPPCVLSQFLPHLLLSRVLMLDNARRPPLRDAARGLSRPGLGLTLLEAALGHFPFADHQHNYVPPRPPARARCAGSEGGAGGPLSSHGVTE